jgi:FKBP-type peptidyl-prolyl cis-trans isomerase SlyD
MKIQNNHVVSIHYTLKTDAGEMLDTSAGRDPLDYIQGKGMIVPGLEKAMLGRVKGDKFSVTVSPEEGYGVRDPQLIQEIPLEAFQGVDKVEAGMSFVARGPQGQMMVRITSVGEKTATIDGNHELAGQNLNFDIEVAELRDATSEELENGLWSGGCCGGDCDCHEEADADHECCGGKGHEDGSECCGGKGHGHSDHGCCGGH